MIGPEQLGDAPGLSETAFGFMRGIAVEYFGNVSEAGVFREMSQQGLEKFDGLCTGCKYCLPCPAEINIPRMMDTYNFRILQGEDPQTILGRLRWHWSIDPKTAGTCTECGLCEKRCTQHLPIKERLKYIAEVAENEENK